MVLATILAMADVTIHVIIFVAEHVKIVVVEAVGIYPIDTMIE